MGKTPIIYSDLRGFYSYRILFFEGYVSLFIAVKGL